MNSLPSPPLQPLPSGSSRHHDQVMETLLASAWKSIQQAPPPSLRDILDAYRTKGDGDRDMLIAMLNAKSAEDQRIASVASLQRSMLEMYQPSLQASSQSIPPLQLSAESSHSHHSHSHSHSPYALHHHYSSTSHMPSPPTTSYDHSPYAHDESVHHSHRRSDSGSFSQRDSLVVPSASPSRKRRRSSSRERVDTHDLPFPPSPYSSASSHSSGGSPRSRESMAIGALLSSSQSRTAAEENARRLSTSSTSVREG
ncbi:uncharacterized protein LAESUDRAFT_726164 [Laetiporus sulphureus 93-53]|uniref:Uncharacterized protein n=1 Tax=Laetiporus sulphureus 93-53 TaxID=1314785 RepID=A0A165E6J5_9APHY|nr:uncharacterized protein LAESUDRAFT_726164 [Laetiporus sulphureus 93-53]KZT06334.1 hypothetical protein LAESUDRAFT_726164 [Laetiporus sulphureus 93-53]